MTQIEKRNKAQYIRLLELMAIIGEEYGEMVKEINDFNWKGNNINNAENALKELKQIISPLLELEGLLEIIIRRKANE